ncbi:nucleotide pyrophosphohydrolase [bacterium]|nr:nucleotide pyrophosphohydrolase [bacterium]
MSKVRSDKDTTIQDLKQLVEKFRDERDWKQFHNPKDLAEAISIESGELLEHFLWKSQKDSETLLKVVDNKKEIASELADIIIYCLSFSNVTDLDISRAIEKKLKQNSNKYPIEKSKGTAKKYKEL